jgi:hypothetical protein
MGGKRSTLTLPTSREHADEIRERIRQQQDQLREAGKMGAEAEKRRQALSKAQVGEPDALGVANLAAEERGETYNPAGTVLDTKKRTHVFNILAKSGSLSRNQAAAAVRLMDVYAILANAGEAPVREDVEGYFTRTELHPAHIAVLRAKGAVKAAEEYQHVCRRIGPFNAALLTHLFHDFISCDHEAPVPDARGKPVPRWRLKVRQFFKARGRTLATPNEESLAVWIACEEIVRAV